jgi:hypothetical protein
MGWSIPNKRLRYSRRSLLEAEILMHFAAARSTVAPLFFRFGPAPLQPSAFDQPGLRDGFRLLVPSIRAAISAAWVATVLLLNTFS